MTRDEVVALRGLIQEGEAWFLYRMAKAAPPQTWAVELGTFAGESTSILCLAVHDGRVVTIDDYDAPGRQRNLHISEAIATALLKSRGFNPHIVKADTRKVPGIIGDMPVGFLFVDSWHVAKQFEAEMAVWGPRIRNGGIVCCHDYGSKKWPEIGPAIDRWAASGPWEQIGLERRLIAFKRRG